MKPMQPDPVNENDWRTSWNRSENTYTFEIAL
jgi:hypothetical protein